jgi:hypothetical protein
MLVLLHAPHKFAWKIYTNYSCMSNTLFLRLVFCGIMPYVKITMSILINIFAACNLEVLQLIVKLYNLSDI